MCEEREGRRASRQHLGPSGSCRGAPPRQPSPPCSSRRAGGQRRLRRPKRSESRRRTDEAMPSPSTMLLNPAGVGWTGCAVNVQCIQPAQDG